jgi:hypothetical protein
VGSFGSWAFRRSLRDDEFKRYVALLSVLRQARAASSSRARACIVEAMLQSPDFLFLTPALSRAKSCFNVPRREPPRQGERPTDCGS